MQKTKKPNASAKPNYMLITLALSLFVIIVLGVSLYFVSRPPAKQALLDPPKPPKPKKVEKKPQHEAPTGPTHSMPTATLDRVVRDVKIAMRKLPKAKSEKRLKRYFSGSAFKAYSKRVENKDYIKPYDILDINFFGRYGKRVALVLRIKPEEGSDKSPKTFLIIAKRGDGRWKVDQIVSGITKKGSETSSQAH